MDWEWFVNRVREEMDGEEMTQEQFNKMMDNYLAERNKLPASGWAKKEFEKAVEAGIVDGTMPQAFATREQVAAMIGRCVLQYL